MTIQTNGDDCRESGAEETSRQQFEDWFQIHWVGKVATMSMFERHRLRNIAWSAWQASRAAIEITSPKFIDSREALSKGFMVDYSNGYGDAMDAYEERLKEAGITVKE